MAKQLTTQLIGLKEFRSNITKIWKLARKNNTRYIVMNHSTPILEVSPISEEEHYLEKLIGDVRIAREQYKRGEVYTQEEVMKKFGVK